MNTIFNASCEEILPKLESKSVDLVLVDLPYGQTGYKWDCPINLDEMWKELKRISKPKCNFIFFTTTKYGVDLINSNRNMFRYDLVWSKPNSNCGYLQANNMPLRKHEMIYVFGRNSCGAKTYNSQKIAGEPYCYKKKTGVAGSNLYNARVDMTTSNESGDRHRGSVFTTDKDGKLHKTQKPLDLCEWIINSYSNEGDVVLDFCMGSGTTIVASINTKRNYIGIEKDTDIFNSAKKRIDYKIETGNLG